MENVEAVFETKQNAFGRNIQILKFNDADDEPSRKMWINEDEALDILNSEFNFQNGKQYRVKYLVSNGWRSGETFTKNENTNLKNYVYSKEYEIANYGGQALEFIKIFGIVVSEVKPKQEINWDDLLDD
jgi:hypothetical protein